MKKGYTHHHTHSLIKMSSLGFIIGLSAAFIGLFASHSLLSFAAPSGFWSIVGTYNSNHTLGSFDTSGGGGNPGQLTFISESDESMLGGSGVYLDTSSLPYQKIIGNFFIETVGWVSMDGNVELIPPSNMNVMTPWTLSGYAWSENAGYIDFIAQDNTYSGVSYVPGTQAFSGYAWSENLGYIPFLPSNPGFKNKVKILGNIAGNKAYDIEYAVGNKFDSITPSSVMNTVHKNIALLTRSLPSGFINTTNTSANKFNDILYYKLSGGLITNPGSKMDTGDVRTLIVEGADIYIDADVMKDTNVNHPRVIIAVKNAAGNGGNIYLKNSVKNIYSSLIAEGSIYSGESATTIYNDTTAKLTSLPYNQLYVNGSVISRNTIGGSARTPVSCPYTESVCTYTTALKYDWNYFRTYDKKPANTSNKVGYDDYSIIIEYDTRIVSDAPPGIN